MTAIITPSQDSVNSLRESIFIKIIEPAINFHPGFRRGYSKLEPAIHFVLEFRIKSSEF